LSAGCGTVGALATGLLLKAAPGQDPTCCCGWLPLWAKVGLPTSEARQGAQAGGYAAPFARDSEASEEGPAAGVTTSP